MTPFSMIDVLDYREQLMKDRAVKAYKPKDLTVVTATSLDRGLAVADALVKKQRKVTSVVTMLNFHYNQESLVRHTEDAFLGSPCVLVVMDLLVLCWLNNRLVSFAFGRKPMKGMPPPKQRIDPKRFAALHVNVDGSVENIFTNPKKPFINEGPLGKFSEDLTMELNVISAKLPPEKARW